MHFDHSMKLNQNEQDEIIQRTIMKEFHRVAEVGQGKGKEVAINSLIMRNYNEGRGGGWDNYCCYKGKNKGTYVDTKNFKDEEDKVNL
mmetsp:Transcript_14683/g.10581  ORF Transcript_14683/g.10581 Transcript_14683/m.10581 type:complete len:88 (+) Transcript_14683:636-899(+)